MPISWTAPDHWNSYEWANRAFNAYNQRAHSVGGTFTPPTVAAGDVMQWISSSVGHPFGWADMQNKALAWAFKFIAPATVPFDADGTDHTYGYNFSTRGLTPEADVLTEAGLSGEFTRYKPRQISTSSSSSDTDGNSAVNGQVAECLADGRRYKRISGVWTKLDWPGQSPDKLCNKSAAPNHATDSTYGVAQVGDYLGLHIPQEIAAVFNKEVWVYLGGFLSTADGTDQNGASGDQAGLDTAKSVAETNWAADTPALGSVTFERHTTLSDNGPDGDGIEHYGASIGVQAGHCEANPWSGSGTVARSVAFFSYGNQSVFDYFDTQGATWLVNNTLTFWCECAPTTGACDSDAFPSGLPSVWPDDTLMSPGDTRTIGCSQDTYAVAKYNVTGGFSEQ